MFELAFTVVSSEFDAVVYCVQVYAYDLGRNR